MRRYFAALALVCGLLAAAAGAEAFRQQQGTTFRQYQTAWRNLLAVLVGSPAGGVTTAQADLCDYASAQGLLTGNYFCLRPDGGAVTGNADGGAAMALAGAGAPVSITQGLCTNGPDCAGITLQHLDGGTANYWATGNAAWTQGSWSFGCLLKTDTAATHAFAKHFSGTGFEYDLAGSSGAPRLYTGDGTTTFVDGAATVQGSWNLHVATFTAVGAGAQNTAVIYLNGTAGTPSTVMRIPAEQSGLPITLGGVAGGQDEVRGCFLTETVLSAPQVTGMSNAMLGATWTDTASGSAVSLTRASTQYCDPNDGGFGSWLRNGEPCIAGGAYLSEPSAQNVLINNNTFTGWTAGNHALWDGGAVASPTVGAAGSCPYPAPDGTSTTAVKVDFPAVSDTQHAGYSLLSKSFTGTAAKWTTSVYARAADATDGGTLYVQDVNATQHSQPADAGSGWTRFATSYTSQATDGLYLGPTTVAAYAAPDTQPSLSVCLWEAQAELGSVATSPITNAGTALTRAATVATVANPLAGINPASFCFGGTVRPLAAWASLPATAGLVHIGTTFTAANTGFVSVEQTGKPAVQIFDAAGGGATKKLLGDAAISAAAHSVFGCSNNGTLSLWVDGVSVAGTLSGAGAGTIATQPATLHVGDLVSGNYAAGYVSAVRAFPGEFRP